MVCEFTVMTGFKNTVTVAVPAVTGHTPKLPVTVYTVVVKGLAVTLLPVDDDKVAEELQV